MSLTQKLIESRTIQAPEFLKTNVMYECYTGSVAYGISTEDSDVDVYGFAIPKREVLFPHTIGVIKGFGDQGPKFEEYIKHHIDYNKKEYDLTIFNITKYFQLCSKCNPNMIDTLFVNREHVCTSTQIGEMVREKRHLFLSKLAYPAFKGYAYGQLNKIKTKAPKPESKRYEQYMRLGFDTKYACHLIRLLDEADQIFTIGDIDLQRNREELKAIRRGDLNLNEIENLAKSREKRLEKVFAESKLQEKPNEQELKSLLLKCLEHHYGSLDKVVHIQSDAEKKIEKIREIIG